MARAGIFHDRSTTSRSLVLTRAIYSLVGPTSTRCLSIPKSARTTNFGSEDGVIMSDWRGVRDPLAALCPRKPRHRTVGQRLRRRNCPGLTGPRAPRLSFASANFADRSEGTLKFVDPTTQFRSGAQRPLRLTVPRHRTVGNGAASRFRQGGSTLGDFKSCPSHEVLSHTGRSL